MHREILPALATPRLFISILPKFLQSTGLNFWLPSTADDDLPLRGMIATRFERLGAQYAQNFVTPAKEALRKSIIGWIKAARPSRPRYARHLRMRNFLNAIRGFPHAEERPAGASRSAHSRGAANFLTASQAGAHAAGWQRRTARLIKYCGAKPLTLENSGRR
jgi:hypothetical protein